MRRIANEVVHGCGYIFLIIGCSVCFMAAAASDSEFTLDLIIRGVLIGLATAATGLFLTRWKI